ncbi:sortase (surface protein transpeptidase) [Actinokineospora baliensis]|uniref:class F sortase n=1 Tax=Actinokineospora baliensis TaxID=547056 RepID=UPI00195E7A74|nr:class F sortase [Actinokineospora baliensis]MBM7772829.1 sortase (surface protein transpeptidase) [Actinokineospora baliensis]
MILRVAFGALGAVVVLFCLAITSATEHPGVASPSSAPSAPTWSVETTSAAATDPRPVRLRIPAIDVDTPLIDIGTDGTGALIPPTAADIAGWFTAGPVPGAVGPALLAGHVDSRAGPGVFYRLVDLRPGDSVEVERADGTRVTFAVASTTRTPKTAFPTDLVYAPAPGPELRLVTCGGAFDRAIRSYRDNVIVEAVLTVG